MLVPWSVAFLLRFLAEQLGGAGRVCEIRWCGADLGEAFRSDAKAEGDTVVVGGWECVRGTRPAEARWFSVGLTRATAPWAFGACPGGAVQDDRRARALRDVVVCRGFLGGLAGLGGRAGEAHRDDGQPR